MKNRTYITFTSLLALTLMGFSPIIAHADSIRLNLGVSNKTDVSVGRNDEDNDDHINVNIGAKATVTNNRSDGNNGHKDKQLPQGIIKRIEDNKTIPKRFYTWFDERFHVRTTSTVDTKAPVIHALHIDSATTTATVTWRTNELTTGEVRFGISSTSSAQGNLVIDRTMSKNHSVTLTGLTTDTKYFVTVTAKDAQGNVKSVGSVKFYTKSISTIDIRAPKIFFSTSFETTASTTHLVWFTNEKSDSRVWISTVEPVNVSASTTISSMALVNVHNLPLTGLAAGTKYFYAIRSADVQGNLSAVATGSFTTASH